MWLDPRIEFCCLGGEGEQTDWDTIGDRYIHYLEKRGNPDCIISAGWPLLVLVLRRAMLKKGLVCPLVGWPHGTSQYYKEFSVGGLEIFQYADHTLAISQCLEDELKHLAPRTRIHLISNPVDVDESNYNVDRGTRELAFVGRLSPEKNIPYILQAVSAAEDDWTLTIVGEGDADGVRKIAEEQNILARVQLLGWQENPWVPLRHAFALVQASFYEGFGLSVVEALLSGMPVLSTPVGIAQTIIHNGENGYFFDINDRTSLTQILNKMSKGMIPIPLSGTCRNSAISFTTEKSLLCLENAIQEILKRNVV